MAWDTGMNSLSWMIYCAELAGSLNALAGIASFFSGATAVGSVIFYLSTDAKPTVWSWENAGVKYHRASEINSAAKALIKPSILACAALGLICAAIPGRNTIYAIAASEMGERAIATPTAGKALKALDAWLDRQIDGDSEPQK